MKRLHRKDLYAWSVFNERLDIDFNSVAWVRPDGIVLIDPLPLTPHHEKHIRELGRVAWVVITNSRHMRGASEIARSFEAQLAGPRAEKHTFELPCDGWLSEGTELVPGLRALEMDGSNTAGELALVLEETTLITGDLVRSHRAGTLGILRPEQGLQSFQLARASVQRLAQLERIEAVLVGDGFCLYENGNTHLSKLARELAQQ